MDSSIVMIDPAAPPAVFKDIKVVYTDLDGTFLAPKATIATNNAGEPSVEGLRMLNALRSADIEVVIATGRCRSQVCEIAKMLHVNTFIGEMGGFTQYGYGQGSKPQFHVGGWKDLPTGKTPAHFAEENGLISRLVDAYPGYLQRLPIDITSAREVSTLIIGIVDVEEARVLLGQGDYPMDIVDNGEVPLQGNELDISENIHIYHVLPRGISKGRAIAADMEARGINPACALAIGDSCGDISMADACGTFVAVENALEAPEVKTALEAHGSPIYAVKGHTIDGWVNCTRTLIAAKSEQLASYIGAPFVDLCSQ